MISAKGIFACALCVVLLLVTFVTTAGGQQQPPGEVEVVDRMMATVNGLLITYSDLLWQLALQPGTPVDSPRKEDLAAALERLIDQRLVLQEAEKLPHVHANEKEIDEALSDLVKRFPSQAEFQQRMSRVGLTAGQLREIVHDRLDMEKYLDFRFRSFTVVTPQEVESYYREVYVPRLRKQSPGRIVPKLEEVRDEIGKRMMEDKVASDTAEFLDEARTTAQITILSQP
ncbi:MAG TPA: SurA N-terminal domain-containing protein [Pyrinomonadaceae bacterium]|nr:SurA N-terminal domain-containing protein [Pyrinomonadaceae bacterium]